VIIFGESKQNIHVFKKDFTTVSVMSGGGTISGHLEKRAINVKQYLNSREDENSPTGLNGYGNV